MDDFKTDKTAIKRATELDMNIYFLLRQEIIKKGHRKI